METHKSFTHFNVNFVNNHMVYYKGKNDELLPSLNHVNYKWVYDPIWFQIHKLTYFLGLCIFKCQRVQLEELVLIPS